MPVAAFFILIIAALVVAGWFWSHQGASDLPQTARSELPVDSLFISQDRSGAVQENTVGQAHSDSSGKFVFKEAAQADQTIDDPIMGLDKKGKSKSRSTYPTGNELTADSPKSQEDQGSTNVEALPRQGIAGALPPQVAVMPGYIDFSVNPWARIYVDGSLKGESPLGYILKTEAGERKFLFDNPYFPLIDLVYNVPANETLKVEVNLFEHVGILSFEIQPWGHVHIDSVQVGVSPLPKSIYLKPGEHYVMVEHPSFNPFERLIKVLPGDTISLLIDLSKQGTRLKDKIVDSK